MGPRPPSKLRLLNNRYAMSTLPILGRPAQVNLPKESEVFSNLRYNESNRVFDWFVTSQILKC